MSCHKFANPGDIFQGNPNDKLMEGVTSQAFMDLECNCMKSTLVNGKCVHGGNCRKSIVVHKATCKECGCYHIGNTQQKLKNRMNQHFTDAKDPIANGELSDSFAKHFASHFENEKHTSRGDARKITDVEMIWQGNPMSNVKTFRSPNCNLCNKERLEIHKAMKTDKKNDSKNLVNSVNELCGGCRHKPEFHGHCDICPEPC